MVTSSKEHNMVTSSKEHAWSSALFHCLSLGATDRQQGLAAVHSRTEQQLLLLLLADDGAHAATATATSIAASAQCGAHTRTPMQ